MTLWLVYTHSAPNSTRTLKEAGGVRVFFDHQLRLDETNCRIGADVQSSPGDAIAALLDFVCLYDPGARVQHWKPSADFNIRDVLNVPHLRSTNGPQSR